MTPDLVSLRRHIGKPLRVYQPNVAELIGTLEMLTVEMFDDPERVDEGLVTFRIRLAEGTWSACTNFALAEVGAFLTGPDPFRTDAHTPILLDWGDETEPPTPVGRRSRRSPLAG